MAEENVQTIEEESEERIAFRRRRVKRIKRLLIFLLIFFLLIPNLVCAFLLYKLYKMDQHIDSLKEEIKISKEEIERRTRESAARKQDEQENAANVVEIEQQNLTDEEKYPDKQLVYLTFDDGPSKYTDDILDILNEHNVKATFFVLGKEGFDDQYNRIVNEGHTLGIHSFSHKYSTIYASLDSFMEDVTAVSDFVQDKTGTKPKFYRFPGGSSNSVHKASMQDMIHYLNSGNYVYYDWNVSSEDASATMKDAGVIARNVINGVGSKKEAVVLMHDAASKRSTVEALPIIIETLQAKGNVVFLPITDGTKQVYHVKEKNAPVKDEDPEPVEETEQEITTEEKSETEADPSEE